MPGRARSKAEVCGYDLVSRIENRQHPGEVLSLCRVYPFQNLPEPGLLKVIGTYGPAVLSRLANHQPSQCGYI